LLVRGSFQSIDHICFYISGKEVNLELLFKVSSGLDGENTSVRFLMEHIFGPLGGVITFEEYEGPENSFFFIMELFWG